MHRLALLALAAGFALVASPRTARAEEGMWLPNALPSAALKEKYGFEASPALREKTKRLAFFP